jgi:hypothetical protein
MTITTFEDYDVVRRTGFCLDRFFFVAFTALMDQWMKTSLRSRFLKEKGFVGVVALLTFDSAFLDANECIVLINPDRGKQFWSCINPFVALETGRLLELLENIALFLRERLRSCLHMLSTIAMTHLAFHCPVNIMFVHQKLFLVTSCTHLLALMDYLSLCLLVRGLRPVKSRLPKSFWHQQPSHNKCEPK